MASIVKLRKGKQPPRAIDFVGADGSRKRVRLGIVSHDEASTAKHHIDRLIACRKLCQPPNNQTQEWLRNLPDTLYARLVRQGLCDPRADLDRDPMATLGSFIDSYFQMRDIRKPNTRRNYEGTRRKLIDFFGPEKRLNLISPGDADEWRNGLLKRRLSYATVSREVKRARQFFQAAVRKRIIDDNPFAGIATPAQVNADREFFVTCEMISLVLDQCPDPQWRLILALSRFGGLRCPSEHLSLTWGDVNWERHRITVRSPKTEHHRGGALRVIPLFEELRPFLEAVYEEAEPGTEYVITRYRYRNCNLRSQLERFIQRAGLACWPKLFHNLRASRQTELARTHPLHVVCDWMGNSAPIAEKHYLQVTEADFNLAIGGATLAQQKAQQQATASSGTDSQESIDTPEKRGERVAVPHAATPCNSTQYPLGESNPCYRTENPVS